MFLNKYSQSIQPAVASEGTAFAQSGKSKGGKKATAIAKEVVGNKSARRRIPIKIWIASTVERKGIQPDSVQIKTTTCPSLANQANQANQV
jgi:hypothetical protein